MFDNDKKITIGVVTARADEMKQKQSLSSIMSQAKLLNVNIVVISNIYCPYEDMYEFESENDIYNLILSSKLDGIILMAESILNVTLQKIIMDKLLQRKDIPIVVMGGNIIEFGNFTCFNDTDELDFEIITNHLIEVHGFKNIDILTGNKEYPISNIRVNGYKKSLKKHGIPFDRNRVHFGDFWTTSGQTLADSYGNKTIPLPQAVVCANDYMAFGLINGLYKYGIEIPKDISIIGYKNLGERIHYNPILTTYKSDRNQSGADAICYLFEKITNTVCTNRLNIKDSWYFGDTCQCEMCSKQLNDELSIFRTQEEYNQLNTYSRFEQYLTECRSIKDYIQVIGKFSYLIRNVYELYICLFENFFDSSYNSPTNTHNMICYLARSDNPTNSKYIGIPINYNQNELLPNIFLDAKKCYNYYFSPIVFSNKMLGYAVINYDTIDGYDNTFRSWCNSISNSLEFLRMKGDIQYLLECQNISETYDITTGLLNNKGLENSFKYIKNKISIEERLICITFKINLMLDNISIDKQDIKIKILKEIAQSLKSLINNEYEYVGIVNATTFMFLGCGNYIQGYEHLLIDKFKTLLIHKPLFLKMHDLNSIIEHSIIVDDSSIDYKNILNSSLEALTNKIDKFFNIQVPKSFYDVRKDIYLNPTKNYNICDISKKLCISESHFRMLYKKYFEISFHQDCINSKISYAKYLILTTQLDISTISIKCCYDDLKYFLRQFHKCVGITPTQYKKNLGLIRIFNKNN